MLIVIFDMTAKCTTMLYLAIDSSSDLNLSSWLFEVDVLQFNMLSGPRHMYCHEAFSSSLVI